MKSSWFGAVFRHTRVTQMFMDPCGTRHVYAPYGHFSLIIPYLFFPHFFTRRLYHPLHHQQSHDRLSPLSQHHVLLQPPYILLLFIRTISPYFTCINRVDTTLYSTLIWVICSLSQPLSKSWNQLHCSLQAFGLYCQRLPGLTTKSTHHYLYSHYFRIRFTFIAQRILPLNAVLQYCATRPFGTQTHDTTVSRHPNSHDSATRAHRLSNRVPHTGSDLK